MQDKVNLKTFPASKGAMQPKLGDKWEIPAFLQQNEASWAKTLVNVYAHPMSFPGSLSPEMGNLLRALILNIAPRNIIEIGTYIGVSTLWIASAMSEYATAEELHCIDLFTDHLNNPWCPGVTLYDPINFVLRNLRNCEFDDFVKVYMGSSHDLIEQVTQEIKGPIDFAFIDGDHTKEGCLADFLKVEPYLSTGGYMLFHDVFPENCGVDGPAHTLLTEIIPNNKYEVCQIYTSPLNFGFALVRKIA